MKMQNVLIVGRTRSGKTTLAKMLASRVKKKVVVFDPYLSGGWPHRAIVYDNLEDVIAEIKKADESKLIIIDEAASFLERDMSWMGYLGRHYGCSFIFIAQGYKAIPPPFREACDTVFVFMLNTRQVDMICEDWATTFESPKKWGEYVLLSAEKTVAMKGQLC